MKLDPIEQKICDKYSARDTQGLVHCFECPLRVDYEYPICKDNISDEEWLALANEPFPWTESDLVEDLKDVEEEMKGEDNVDYGELCEAVNETYFCARRHPERGGTDKIVREAVQVAAVAVKIIEQMQKLV